MHTALIEVPPLPTTPRPRVGVLGCGFAALVSAHYLLKAGLEPLLIETSTSDPLADRVRVGGHTRECFPLPFFPRDVAITGLLADIGAARMLQWRGVEAIGAAGGATYAAPLRHGSAHRGLERGREADALGKTRIPQVTWRSLIHRRFGCRAGRTGSPQSADALHLWTEKHLRFGHLNGGLRALEEVLRRSVVARGARLAPRRARGRSLDPPGGVAAVVLADPLGCALRADTPDETLTAVIAWGWRRAESAGATLCLDPALGFDWVYDPSCSGEEPIHLLRRRPGGPAEADDVVLKQAEETLCRLGFTRTAPSTALYLRRVGMRHATTSSLDAGPLRTEAVFTLSTESSLCSSPVESTVIRARETVARIKVYFGGH